MLQLAFGERSSKITFLVEQNLFYVSGDRLRVVCLPGVCGCLKVFAGVCAQVEGRRRGVCEHSVSTCQIDRTNDMFEGSI